MNKEESLKLYKQGKESWNIWANEMLVIKSELEEKDLAMKEWESEASIRFSGDCFEGVMDFFGYIFPYNVNFNHVVFLGEARFGSAIFNGDISFEHAKFFNSVDFMNVKFVGNTKFSNVSFVGASNKFGNERYGKLVNFANAIFNSKAEFINTRFSKDAVFIETTFNDEVNFESSEFLGEALFHRAKFYANAWLAKVQFKGNAQFESAEFKGNARFHDAIFSQDMLFDQILFKGFADFSRAKFKKKISFIAIQGNGYFSFKDTHFYLVPDFNQAHFIEAPQFDESDFSIAIANRQYDNNGINNISSKWRSLKRLSIQAHDHKSELFFFAEEIKSQRGVENKAFPDLFNLVWQGGSQYWIGLLYEFFSDFGRSVWRPIFWLAYFIAIFFLIYLNPFTMQNEKTTQRNISCERTEAAFYLSVRHAFPIFFVASQSEKLTQSYDCLYGHVKGQPATAPDTAIYAGVVQTAISTMFVFLILLALRNLFKIK